MSDTVAVTKQQNVLRANGVSVVDSGFSCSPLQVKKLALMLTMTNQTTASVFSLSPWKADQAQCGTRENDSQCLH